MRALITGVTGAVGSVLADLLVSEGHEVHGLKRWRSDLAGVAHLLSDMTLQEGDIEDAHSVDRILERVRPDWVFHLAAQSYPSESWDAPAATFRVNVEGTINVLEATRRRAPNARVHVAGTSAQYGPVDPADTPITEQQPLRPSNPYGLSKVAAEQLAGQYYAAHGLWTVVTRSFNHVGPYQADRCSIQAFCRQMADIEMGLQSPALRVGNLHPVRDFTHTRDAVRALRLLIEQGEPGTAYNLCSGRGVKMGDIVEMVRRAGRVPVTVEVDPARVRRLDEPVLVGDPRALRERTLWRPLVDIDEIVTELLDYWRARHACPEDTCDANG